MDKLSKTTPDHYPKGWGSEDWIVNNDMYCGKLLKLQKGKSCSMHFHKNKHETFYITKGSMYITLIDTRTADKYTLTLETGYVLSLPPLTPHKFTTLEDTEFFEFSTKHEESDSYRVEPGDSQKREKILRGLDELTKLDEENKLD